MLNAIVCGQLGNQPLQAAVLSLGKGGFDAAARELHEANLAAVLALQAFGGVAEIQLDHFRRAARHQEYGLDIGATLNQLANHPVQLFVTIGETGEVLVLQDRRGKARFGEDHHTRRRLQQMGASAGTDHQEEGILDLAVQPDDRREPTEYRALPPLLPRLGSGITGEDGAVHDCTSRRGGGGSQSSRSDSSRADSCRSESSRALLSLTRNCAAFTT